MITEHDAKRFQAAKAYKELVGSSQWEQIKADLQKDVDVATKALLALRFVGGKEEEHDILIQARTRLQLIKDVEGRATEYDRLMVKLSQEDAVKMPQLNTIASLPEVAVD